MPRQDVSGYRFPGLGTMPRYGGQPPTTGWTSPPPSTPATPPAAPPPTAPGLPPGTNTNWFPSGAKPGTWTYPSLPAWQGGGQTNWLPMSPYQYFGPNWQGGVSSSQQGQYVYINGKPWRLGGKWWKSETTPPTGQGVQSNLYGALANWNV